MANNVFANGRELACKAGSGKTICAFPDTCFTPPENPATPPGVPVPYPNTGFASDTTKGSKNVKITNKEIMLKNKSYFKTSVGDEAGCAAKKGVITSKNKGKVYFKAWSMDVKVEGENVDRHLDLTTNNHACDPGDTPPWIFTDRMAMAKGLASCDEEIAAVERECDVDEEGNVKCPPTGDADYYDDKSMEAYASRIQNDKCQKAARCLLSTYETDTDDPKSKGPSCCPPQTPHHLIPKASFFDPSFAAWKDGAVGARRKANCGGYNYKTAPCVCAEGGKHAATHGLLHSAQADDLAKVPTSEPYDFGKASDIAAKNMTEVFPDSNCSEQCIKAQLRRGGHKGIKNDTRLNRKSQKPKKGAVALDKFKKFFAKITGTGGTR